MPEIISVIGTINKDSIYLHNGTIKESYGGLLYTIIPLDRLLSGRFVIRPILNIGKDRKSDILSYLANCKSLDMSCVRYVDQKNNHCHLYYADVSNKTEILKGGVPGLRYGDLKAALDSKLVIVNFISGSDLPLRALEKFRKEYNGRIYMDIHSLTLGRRKDGGRFLRKPVNWKRYCACADYLQMNEIEFALLSGDKAESDSLVRFFRDFRLTGLKTLLLTMGQKGAFLVYRKNRSIVCKIHKSPTTVKIIDTTGCGDVFGAAFCASLVMDLSLTRCIKQAVLTAAEKCRFSGLEKLRFKSLKRIR